MVILGIAHSHEAHACIVKDGTLVNCVAEERLSRLKAESSFPKRAVNFVLEDANLKPSDIDVVAVCGLSGRLFLPVLQQNARFSVDDFVAQQNQYWRPKLIEGEHLTQADEFSLFSHLRNDLISDLYFPIIDRQLNSDPKNWTNIATELQAKLIAEYIGVPETKIKFFRHEDCHKYYGLYSSSDPAAERIVLTIEGGGDDSSATVSTSVNGLITEHWSSNDVMLGRLYQYITLLLGMKPGQHEYKVMGLAPYGNEYIGKKSLEFFRKINVVDGFKILNRNPNKDLYFSSLEALQGQRFDGIAWGLQAHLEEVLCEWVTNCIKQFNIKDVILSGGVSQNIKACKAIVEHTAADTVWVGPISGDGSLAIGAAWQAHLDGEAGTINGINSIYLGPEYSQDQINRSIEKTEALKDFDILQYSDPSTVAKMLADGMIVARFSGRMEFGQRALGNRSILADPRNRKSLDYINQKVKFRDFWMPFTPSMTFDEASRILQNPKEIYSPFMMMAFDLKEEFVDDLPAVQHPADRTVRPQMLKRESNIGYHDLLEEFKKLTGFAVLLNTSFNLHGDPIVNTPEEAIDSMRRSRIDALAFDHCILLRK